VDKAGFSIVPLARLVILIVLRCLVGWSAAPHFIDARV